MSEWQNIEISFPVNYIFDEGHHLIANSDETDNIIGQVNTCVQGDSFEDAKKVYFEILKSNIEYLEERSRQLDLWKPFQKGDWKQIGGTWFTTFGINVYFRYGKGMKYGRYIPFTKLNISISNYWRRIKKF